MLIEYVIINVFLKVKKLKSKKLLYILNIFTEVQVNENQKKK